MLCFHDALITEKKQKGQLQIKIYTEKNYFVVRKESVGKREKLIDQPLMFPFTSGSTGLVFRVLYKINQKVEVRKGEFLDMTN